MLHQLRSFPYEELYCRAPQEEIWDVLASPVMHFHFQNYFYFLKSKFVELLYQLVFSLLPHSDNAI